MTCQNCDSLMGDIKRLEAQLADIQRMLWEKQGRLAEVHAIIRRSRTETVLKEIEEALIGPAISPCPACNGNGYDRNGTCQTCNGVGRIDDGSVEFAIASAISKIALQARRNGATGDRRWSSLSSLPLAGSWVAIGEMYAPEILKEIGLRAVKVAARSDVAKESET